MTTVTHDLKAHIEILRLRSPLPRIHAWIAADVIDQDQLGLYFAVSRTLIRDPGLTMSVGTQPANRGLPALVLATPHLRQGFTAPFA